MENVPLELFPKVHTITWKRPYNLQGPRPERAVLVDARLLPG